MTFESQLLRLITDSREDTDLEPTDRSIPGAINRLTEAVCIIALILGEK